MKLLQFPRVATLCAALALAAGVSTPVQAQEKAILGFAAPPNITFAFIWYGQKLGYYRDEGLALEVVAVNGSGVLLPMVASGQVHLGIANPDLAITALAKGQPLPITFVMNWFRAQVFEFVVLDSSPIKKLADLKGKKLGIISPTAGNLPLSRAMLAGVNLTAGKDVEFLPIGLGAAAWRRLQNGEVDAMNMFVSEHGRMELAGIPIRRLPMPEQYRTIFSNGLVAPNKVIAENPKLIGSFGRVIAKSWIACKANVEACVRAYWEAVPTSKPVAAKEAEQLQMDMQQAMIDRSSIDDFSGFTAKKYGSYSDASWKSLIKVLSDEGQIARPDVDLTKLYSGQFIDAINNFDPLVVERQSRAAK